MKDPAREEPCGESLEERIRQSCGLVSQGRHREALEGLAGIVVQAPGLRELYPVLSELCMRTGRSDIPEEWIRVAVQSDSSFVRSFLDFAAGLYAREAFVEAGNILAVLSKVDPQNAEVWNDLAVVQMTAGDAENAEESFRRALVLDPEYEAAVKNLVLFHFARGNADRAYQACERFVGKGRENAQAFLIDIGSAIRGSDPEEAERYFARALEIDGQAETNEGGPKTSSGPNGGRAYAVSDRIAARREAAHLDTAIWFLTWKCNNRCPYCWEVQRQARGEFHPEEFKDARVWADAWNRLKPGVLDITGGEPWLQPGFIGLLQDLDDGIRVAVTTNATKDLTEFVEKISPEQVFSMTLSLHPTERMQADLFLGKALLLKNRGFTITVNFVTWPEQMWLIPTYKELFEGHGLRFHVDPYAPTPHYPYTFSEREKEFLQRFIGGDRENWLGNAEQYPVLCSGGYGHVNVQPNGDAYRCINDKILEKGRIGNVLDPAFRLHEEWTRCDDYHRCPGCDRDKVRVKRMGEDA